MKNGCFSLILCVLILFFSDFSSCFTSNNMGKKLLGNSKLYLFDFFKPKNTAAPVNGNIAAGSKSAPTATKATGSSENKNNYKLEKISYSQNRNYDEEFKKPVVKEVTDKQVSSYNYKKPNEFPNLFEGWLPSKGDQINKQISSSLKNALKSNVKYMEILFDPIPNLEEVTLGTPINLKFRKEISAALNVPDYATNRGASATIDWSNIYWASRLAIAGGKKKTVVITLSNEGLKGQYLPKLPSGMSLVTLGDAKKTESLLADAGLVIFLGPCQQSHYTDLKSFGDKLNAPVIALNAPFSYKYDIGGGSPYSLVYVMKRIPKGWIYRQYPKPFECVIEGPNYDIFQAQTFPAQPSLKEIAVVSMKASADKYGAAGNDRIFQNRL